jgi:trehalose utilization protein
MAHDDVSDGLIDRVQQRVLKGMGCWFCIPATTPSSSAA